MIVTKQSGLIAALALTCLLGCASRPTMDELTREAARTGDWSKVEERERMDRKMGLVRPDSACPNGQVLLCEKKGEKEICECVSSHSVQR